MDKKHEEKPRDLIEEAAETKATPETPKDTYTITVGGPEEKEYRDNFEEKGKAHLRDKEGRPRTGCRSQRAEIERGGEPMKMKTIEVVNNTGRDLAASARLKELVRERRKLIADGRGSEALTDAQIVEKVVKEMSAF